MLFCTLEIALFPILEHCARLRPQYIKRRETVASLLDCERMCLREKAFHCLSFNYIQRGKPSLPINCELSQEHHRQLDFADANHFEISEDHDYYARERSSGIGKKPALKNITSSFKILAAFAL